MTVRLLQGDCRQVLRTLPDASVHCCVTSPPYFGLRDYGVDGQIGLEPTPAEYVEQMVAVFREVRRVLRDDGTLWLNLGDSYAGYHGNKNAEIPTSSTNGWTNGYNENKRGGARPQDIGLKPKDLIGISPGSRVVPTPKTTQCPHHALRRPSERRRSHAIAAMGG